MADTHKLACHKGFSCAMIARGYTISGSRTDVARLTRRTHAHDCTMAERSCSRGVDRRPGDHDAGPATGATESSRARAGTTASAVEQLRVQGRDAAAVAVLLLRRERHAGESAAAVDERAEG